ncbi:MAG: MerR family transcriptional regulator [Actinobacteria bacterium]|nr:MerR family transcriptional regulator [Actinomycetota bacterium]
MDNVKEEGLYIISVAARLAQVHPQTLRLYERKGLLCPNRTAKNRRRYSDADIIRLKRIQELTQVEGLNLSGVRMVLDMENEIETLHSEIKKARKEAAGMQKQLKEEIRSLKKHVALVKMPPQTGIAVMKRFSRL